MSEIQFIYWAEVPFRIYAEPEKGQLPTWTDPGYPPQMNINRIEVAGDELHGLEQPFKDDVTMEKLIEHVEIAEGDRIYMEAWEREEE